MKNAVLVFASFAALLASAAVPFKIGVAGYTFYKRTLDDALAIMQKADVHYLCVKNCHLPLGATDAEIKAFREKCASFGVAPYAIGPIYVKDAAKLREQFEFAKRLGVKMIVGVPYEPTDEKDTWHKRRGSRHLLEVADTLVKEFDIRYAIHNHGPGSPEMFPDVEYGWNLIKDLDPRIGFCIDVGWEYDCGKDPAATIRKYADRIFDAHIKNFPKGKSNGGSAPLPRGKIDLVPVFQAFADIGYNGVCALEYERDFEDNLLAVIECIAYERGISDAIKGNAFVFPDAPFEMPPIVVPQFAARDFSIVDFGAKEGVKATEAFAKAMAACEAAGGGRVVVPNGKWLTGAVHFRNNCNLHLADGATLEFTDDLADYLPVVHTTWEGVECLNYSPLLYAYGVTNVAITGKGLIAPRMDFWRTWFTRPPEHMYATECLYHWCSTNAVMSARDLTAIKGSNVRPHLIQFNRCGNVLLDGFRIRESPFWTIHLYHSENCVVRNLDVYAHGHNNDGVDIEMTRNVLVENCRFDQGDDGIVLKAGRNQDAWRLNRPTENVVVRNCEFAFAHTLLGIGSELSGGIRNVWMHHCKLSTAFNLFFVKTNRRRGGFVKNIYFEDIESDNVKGAVVGIKTDVLYQWARFPDYELRRTEIDGLHIRNIRANCADHAIDITGDAVMPVRNVEMVNIWLGACRKEFEQVENAVGVVKRDVRLGNLAPKAWVRQIDEVWHHKSAVRVREPNYDEAKVGAYRVKYVLRQGGK